jgi:glycerophosphoryl diester phosphodiesterase
MAPNEIKRGENMKHRRVTLLQIIFAFLMCVLLTCTLSCSHKENLGSYLDFLNMTPPVDEPLSFEIVGHRGYGSTAPENTLAALRRSIKKAVKVAEVDIRLTSDGIPVLLHDESLSRTTGNPHLVSELTLSEVKKLDAGSYNSIEFKGEQIPTLEEALQLTRGKLKMLLHMKLPNTGPVIADVIRKTAFPVTDILVMSDQFDTISKMNSLMPGVGLVHLVFELPAGPAAQREYVQKQIKAGATRAALALAVPDEDYMAVAHRVGLRVLFWTADHPYDSVEVDRFTADGVITNKPLMWEDWAALIRKES